MRILFDARGVQERSDGLSNYIRHLLTALLQVDAENEYVVLLNAAMRRHLADARLLTRPNLRAVLTSIPFMGLPQQVGVPWLLRRLPRASVYHYPHFDLPLLAHARSVVTIHDLNQICLPMYFDSSKRAKRWYSLATTRASLSKARHVITISQASRRELLRRFAWLDPRKVSVVYYGLDDAFRSLPDHRQLEQFREKFQLGQERYLLYVGTQRPHKNLERLVQAYHRCLRRSSIRHKLLLVGPPNGHGRLQRLIESLQLQGCVRCLDHLNSEELSLAYRAADALVFCSLSEGFGLPLLEAMASELPILTSNCSAMAEVAADSAVLADPYSIDSIADGLSRLLASDHLQQQLRENGRARVQQFRWETAARQTLDIYRMLGEGRRPQ